jgi:O-antigen/teichoic acid export membrane protein
MTASGSHPEPPPVVDSTLVARIATNTLVQAVGAILGSLISFATFVAVTRGLGVDAFGDLTAASVYLFIVTVLADVGFSGAVLREISASPARVEHSMRASVPLRALVSLAALVISVLIALAAPFNEQTTMAILIGAVGAFFTLMNFAVLPVLQLELRMQWAVFANLVGRLATLGLTLWALALGLGFNAVVAAASIGLALTFLVDLVVVARLVSLRPIVDLAYWRSLSTGSVELGLSGAIAQIYFRVDALLVALLRAPREVGLYGAAYKFIELAETSAAFLPASVFPALTRYVAEGDSRVRPLVQRGFDLLLATAAPLTVVMIAFSEEIISVTAGEEFADGAVALQILAPYVLFSFVGQLLWRTLVASHRDRALLLAALAILTLNVALNLALIPVYGYKAAAVTSVASQIVATAITAVVVRRAVGFLPDLRYAPVVGAGVAAMAAVVVWLPAATLVVAFVSVAAYILILAVAPGAGRETLLDVVSHHSRRGSRTAVTTYDPVE